MVRIRHGWLVAVIGLALPLATACKKDEKKSDTAAGDKADKATGDRMAEKPPAGSPSDDLALLPVDSELVFGINFAQVQQSSLWKQFVEPKLMSGDVAKKVTEFKDKCGFDPMASVKTVSAGIKPSGDKPEGAVVVHGVDKAKAWACADKMKEEMAKDGSEFTRDGDVGLVKDKNGNTMAFTFVNDSTVLAVLGEKANAAGVKAAAAGGSALKSSQAFTDMYSKVKTSDSVWFLVNGKVLDKAGSMGIKPKAVFGSINVTDGLTFDGRVRLDTPEAATQLTNMAKSQAQQAAKMFDKIDVTSEGSEMKMSIVLSNQKLTALIAQIGGLLGAFGGGPGNTP
jgi:hypothetical protein